MPDFDFVAARASMFYKHILFQPVFTYAYSLQIFSCDILQKMYKTLMEMINDPFLQYCSLKFKMIFFSVLQLWRVASQYTYQEWLTMAIYSSGTLTECQR